MFIIFEDQGKMRMLNADVSTSEANFPVFETGPFLCRARLEVDEARAHINFTAVHTPFATFFMLLKLPVFYRLKEPRMDKRGMIISGMGDTNCNSPTKFCEIDPSLFDCDAFLFRIRHQHIHAFMFRNGGAVFGIPFYNYYQDGKICLGTTKRDIENPYHQLLYVLSSLATPHITQEPRIGWDHNPNTDRLEPEDTDVVLNSLDIEIPTSITNPPIASISPL